MERLAGQIVTSQIVRFMCIKRVFFILALCAQVGMFSACSSRVRDGSEEALLKSETKKTENDIVIISNSAKRGGKLARAVDKCAQTNSYTVQVSVAPSSVMYCQDLTQLGNFTPGWTCPGGVEIKPFSVGSQFVNCTQLTVCGKSPTGQSESTGADGGKIYTFQFNNLPWGCQGKLITSITKPVPDKQLNIDVEVPACQYTCNGVASCVPCASLPSYTIPPSSSCTSNCKTCSYAGAPVAHMEFRKFYRASQPTCPGRCEDDFVQKVCNDGGWVGDTAYNSPSCTDANCPCISPLNAAVSYLSGANHVGSKVASPACGQVCDSKTFTCQSGVWKDSAGTAFTKDVIKTQYPVGVCTPPQCDCRLTGDNSVVGHGAVDVPAFSTNSVACGQNCTAGKVSCTSGILSNAIYKYATCTVGSCGCRMPNGSGYVNNSDPKTFSKTDRVGCNKTCESIQVRCNMTDLKWHRMDGTLVSDSEIALYPAQSCYSVGCDCYPPDKPGAGMRTPTNNNNSTPRSYYKTKTRACGESCYGAGQSIELNCKDGAFSAPATVGLSHDQIMTQLGADYKEDTCRVDTCGCQVSLDGGATSIVIPTGSSREVYALKNEVCTDLTKTCSSPSQKAVITCPANGAAVTGADLSVFKYSNCMPASCSCSFNGASIPYGSSTNVYKVSTVQCGESCEAQKGIVTCDSKGILSGNTDAATYKFMACNVDDKCDAGSGGGRGGGTGNDEGPGTGFARRGSGGGTPGKCDGPICAFYDFRKIDMDNCVLPWGGVIYHGGVFTGYSRTCAAAGQKCSQYMQVRKCLNRHISGDPAFKEISCIEKASCP